MPFNKIVATYKAATPVYLGNEDPSVPAKRLREASFKGVLRFWWRALFWQEFWEKAKHDEGCALALLKQAEGELFGAASDNKRGQQALFCLRAYVECKGQKADNPEGVGWDYLRGQGLAHREPAFNAGSIFRVELLLKPRIKEAQEEQLLKALVALGLFGGIGARSRRGVGSLSIQKLNKGQVPNTAKDLTKIKQWLSLPAKCPLPPFSAFSELAESWFQEEKGEKAPRLIGDFGCHLMDYRSYYQVDCSANNGAGKINLQKKSTPNFQADHDNMLLVAQANYPQQAPERAVFGIPHNYYFRSLRKGVEVHHPNYDRRASPYFIHAHVFPDGSSGIIHSLLPAPFPENSLQVKQTRVPRGQRPFITTVPFMPNWNVVRAFMRGFGKRFI